MEQAGVPRYSPRMAKQNDDARGVKIRIPSDIAERFQTLGEDWEARIHDALRAHLDDGPVKGMADRIADAVAPLRDHPLAPHFEKAVKDFGSKVAKDVAAAAGAAALAAWTAGLAKRDGKPEKPPRPAKPKA